MTKYEKQVEALAVDMFNACVLVGDIVLLKGDDPKREARTRSNSWIDCHGVGQVLLRDFEGPQPIDNLLVPTDTFERACAATQEALPA